MFESIAQRLSDTAKARIRTFWPYLIGAIATWLVARLRPLGLHIDSVTLGAVVSWVLGTVLYEAGRWLATRHGRSRGAKLARGVGRWLVSIGLPIQAPTYSGEPGLRPAAREVAAKA
jgi:hypothetical protein